MNPQDHTSERISVGLHDCIVCKIPHDGVCPIGSVVLNRLIEEVRNDPGSAYNRTYNRWMGTPGQGPEKYNRTYNRHNR